MLVYQRVLFHFYYTRYNIFCTFFLFWLFLFKKKLVGWCHGYNWGWILSNSSDSRKNACTAIRRTRAAHIWRGWHCPRDRNPTEWSWHTEPQCSPRSKRLELGTIEKMLENTLDYIQSVICIIHFKCGTWQTTQPFSAFENVPFCLEAVRIWGLCRSCALGPWPACTICQMRGRLIILDPFWSQEMHDNAWSIQQHGVNQC